MRSTKIAPELDDGGVNKVLWPQLTASVVANTIMTGSPILPLMSCNVADDQSADLWHCLPARI